MKFITVQKFRELKADVCLIDVRTPSEFDKGHIKGAINIPLFTDEERAIVGTMYKQQGQSLAILKGLDFVGIKMSVIVKAIDKIHNNKLVCVQCWRGGKRSQSVSWLLDFYGIQSVCIQGGYKAYRQGLKDDFNNTTFKLILLGGLTGSGKTSFLNAYHQQGAQIIDLEKLANHKGSAFGALGEEAQMSNEQFSTELYEMFLSQDANLPIWLESESKSIGKNIIPDDIWAMMLKAPRIELAIPHAIRLENLIALYGEFDKQGLSLAFDKIKKRLGGQSYINAIKALDEGDYLLAADIALKYYDKAYMNSREKSGHDLLFSFEYNGLDHEEGINLLEEKLKKNGKEINRI